MLSGSLFHCMLLGLLSGVSLFTHSLYVSYFVMCAFQIVLECHLQCVQYQRYCPAVMGVAFMFLLFLVISWHAFVMHITYDLFLWL